MNNFGIDGIVNNISFSEMGTATLNSQKPDLTTGQEELVFYMDVDDPNLGWVKIYTSKKIPLCYILKYERRQQDTQIYNLFKKIEQLQSGSLLNLYGFNIERQVCCKSITTERVTSYWEYYNFYFNQYLEKRSGKGCMFVETQVWHVVDVCCETYSLFRKYGTYYEINSSTFVITPEGKLKAFWSHLRSQNNHLKYFQYFDNGHQLEQFYYSPEEIECIYNQERTTKIDFDKCNSFRLGMILLQALSLTETIYLCYNPSMTKINFSAIRGLIINKVVPSYSNEIVTLIKNLLKENPKQRPTIMEVYEAYSSKFNSEYELRVCGGKNKDETPYQGATNEMRQIESQKKPSDFSDSKTIKLSHSLRKT